MSAMEKIEMMQNKSLDIIVIGATGYTGTCTVKYLASLTNEKYCDVTWGISGRSKLKLQKLIMDLSESGYVLKNIPIIECDVENEESVRKAVQMAKVVINCTGPNVLLSPTIVRTCIETGTHYLDISAEVFHMLKLYRDFHKAAEDADVLITPGCGYSVIPSEAALIHLDRQFKGTLHTVECYTEIIMPKRAYIPGRSLLHNGTWTSLVYVLENFKEHIALWKELFPQPVEAEPEEMNRSFFHRNHGRCWFPYPGTENELTNMSQRYLHQKSNKKPVHYRAYTTVSFFLHWIVVPIMFLYYYLSYFTWFRKLLINFPRLVTLGYVSEKGPSEAIRKDMKYYFRLEGKGWELGSDTNSKPNKKMTIQVSGCDPGYDTTAVAIIMCAITILKESSNMPRGGVIMPGAAFYRTDIVDRLQHDGYRFEVIKDKDKEKEVVTI